MQDSNQVASSQLLHQPMPESAQNTAAYFPKQEVLRGES